MGSEMCIRDRPNDKENETPLKSTSSSLSKSREREKEKGQEVPQTKRTRKVSPAGTISRISPHLSALGLGRLEEPYRCLRAEHTSLVFFFARARPPRETSSFNGKKLKRRDSPRFHFFKKFCSQGFWVVGVFLRALSSSGG